MIKILLLTFTLFALTYGQIKDGKTNLPKPIKLQDNSPPPFPENHPEVNVTFVITAKNLPSSDMNTKVDPFVKILSQKGNLSETDKTELIPLGRTDTLKDNDNPVWNNVFWIIWKKGRGQKLHFLVKDHDVLNKDDSIGDAIIDLDEFDERNQHLTVPLSTNGTITMSGTTPIYFRLNARNLPKKDNFNGLSDPYVKIYYRFGRDGQDVKFHQTKVIDNVENADWKERIEFDNYLKGRDMYLHFKVKDHDSVTHDDELGEAFMEIDSYVSKKAPISLNLEGPGVDKRHRATLGIVPA